MARPVLRQQQVVNLPKGGRRSIAARGTARVVVMIRIVGNLRSLPTWAVRMDSGRRGAQPGRPARLRPQPKRWVVEQTFGIARVLDGDGLGPPVERQST